MTAEQAFKKAVELYKQFSDTVPVRLTDLIELAKFIKEDGTTK